MPYKFETEARDYSDYASGRFFYGLPGQPALPVRLTSELFLRGQHRLGQAGVKRPLSLYDPCCGAAYHLATLAVLHGDKIGRIVASDVDERVMETAVRNLSLLSMAGWQRRMSDIERLHQRHGKASHAAAAESGKRLGERLRSKPSPTTRTFVADGTNGRLLKTHLKAAPIDMVIADVPYGQRTRWEGRADDLPFLWRLLDALTQVVSKQAMVIIVANKAQKCDHDAYQRVERFQIGKRRITFLQKSADADIRH